MWSQSTNVTDGQTDGQTDRRHAIPRPRKCTKVHCAVKTNAECIVKLIFPSLDKFHQVGHHGLWPSLSNPVNSTQSDHVCMRVDHIKSEWRGTATGDDAAARWTECRRCSRDNGPIPVRRICNVVHGASDGVRASSERKLHAGYQNLVARSIAILFS